MSGIIGKLTKIIPYGSASILTTSLRIIDNKNKYECMNYMKTVHSNAYYKSGALKPKPETTDFAAVRVILVILPGLLLGATISKYIANFLEENDLFVPEDDDDDD